MLTLRTKKDILKGEFDVLNLRENDLISRDDLYRYLDSKCQYQFDRNVADQLYERMEKDYDGKVSLGEFLNVYLEAEEVLLNKIDNTKLGIHEAFSKKQEASAKLNEAVRIERLNSYGVMEGSVLNVTVIQAQNLARDDMNFEEMQTYVVCSCGSQKFQTQRSSSFNPVWNESFLIGINNGNETIQLMVMDYDINSRDEVLGLVNVDVQYLRDQTRHDDWFELVSNKGIRSNGRILLSMQWIYSQVLLYTDLVKGLEESLKTLQDDLVSYETDLASLYEPFSNLMVAYKAQVDLRQSEAPVEKPKPPEISPASLVDKITGLLFAFYGLLIMLIFWNRACFIDILTLSAFFILIYFRILGSEKMAHIALSMFFSEILDLSWLIIYTDGYWNGSENVLADIEVTLYLNRFVIMISYFAFFLKIGILVWLFFKKTLDYKTIIHSFSN